MGRLADVARQILVSVDQLTQVAIVGAAYLVRMTDTCPSADETISSYVGRADLRGRRWARAAAAIIDRIFILLGEAPGHCRRNVEAAFLGRPPLP